MPRIVPVGQAVHISIVENIPANATGKVVATNVNDVSTEYTSWRNKKTSAEFVVPAEFVTESNTPAVITCYINDHIVKVVEIDVDTHEQYDGAPGPTGPQGPTGPTGPGLSPPSYAGTRTNLFDAHTGWYNLKASNTRLIKSALGFASAASGTTLRAGITVVSDSFGEGYMGPTQLWQTTAAWPNILKSRLVAEGIADGGTGLVHVGNKFSGMTGVDSRVTFAGAWTNGDTSVSTTAQNATATFVATGTEVDVAIWGQSTNYSITIDGNAQTATPSGAASVQVHRYTGLSDASHTVVVTKTGTTGILFLHNFFVGRARGVVVNNLSDYGSKATDWLSSTNSSLWGTRSAGGPSTNLTHLMILSLTANDYATDSVATMKTNLTTIRNKIPGANVILVSYPQFGAAENTSKWTDYMDMWYDLADELDCPLLDLFHRYGPYSIAGTVNGLISSGDQVHPVQALHFDVARALSRALTN